LLNTVSVSDNTATPANEVNSGKGFEPDPTKQSALGTAGRTFEVDIIDKNFKLPQVARFNLATDIKWPGGINATFEGIYSKQSTIFYIRMSILPRRGIVDQAYNNGFDKRIAYSSSTGAGGRRLNPNITNAILISNTNKGYSYNLTFQLRQDMEERIRIACV